VAWRLPLAVLAALLVGLLYPAILLNIAALSFGRLGLTPQGGLVLLTASLLGSIVNIPISRRRIVVQAPRRGWFFGFIFYHPPRVLEQVIAINLGGAIIPTAFSVYLLSAVAPLSDALLATGFVAVLSRALSRPVQGLGITMPVFVAPLASAAAAVLLAPEAAPPVAYISGSLGTLIGADLLNWPAIRRMRGHMLSIGGAGVFDGVFISGILAVLLTA
jgi:uncharacterized membrane protein